MTARVSFRFNVLDPKVKQLSTFDVVLMATDKRLPAMYTYQGVTRSCPRGVFAAYLNVLLETGILKVLGVKYTDRYANQRIFKQTSEGFFFVGGFAGVAYGAPRDVEICRFTVKACELYSPDPFVTSIGANVAGVARPQFDTLVYGVEVNLAEELGLTNERMVILPEEIEFNPLSLTIMP